MNAELFEEAEVDGAVEALRQEAVAIRKKMGLASIQIIATRHEDLEADGSITTRRLCAGIGDHYARFGATIAWIESEKNSERRAGEEE